MFHKLKDKDVDITSLNNILRTGSKIINISYFMVIVILILLATYLVKEWNILHFIKEFFVIISPVFIGFIIAWLFEPMVAKLQKRKIPRIVGCLLVYLLIIGVMIIFSYLFVPTLISQVKDFVVAAPGIFEDLTNFLINIIQKFDAGRVVDTVDLKENIMSWTSDYGLAIVSDLPKYVLDIVKSLVSGGLNVVLGLMVGFYLLYDFNKVNNNIKRILPKTWIHSYDELSKRINTSLRSYVQGVLIIMFLVFLTQTIGLTLAGLEAPVIFALFCALTDIIPYFGPYIGAIPAVIVGFTISPITGVCVLISIVIVQLLENNFYQPLIMGHTMKLHPVTIMLGLLIFQHFFGIIGMVIATPVIACIKVFAVFFNEKFCILDRFGSKTENDEIIQKKNVKNIEKKA